MGDLGNLSEKEKKTVAPGWHRIEEVRMLSTNAQNDTYTVDGISRDSDGFSLILETSLRGVEDQFLCRGSFGEFKFEANRKSTYVKNPGDTYVVYLDLLVKETPNFEMIKKYAKDIRDGLLAFPNYPIFKNISVEYVKFKLDQGLLKDAEEIQA